MRERDLVVDRFQIRDRAGRPRRCTGVLSRCAELLRSALRASEKTRALLLRWLLLLRALLLRRGLRLRRLLLRRGLRLRRLLRWLLLQDRRQQRLRLRQPGIA